MVQEKAYKNQVKIAVCRLNQETKKQQVHYCLVNFNRQDDQAQFQTKFTEAVEALKPKDQGAAQ